MSYQIIKQPDGLYCIFSSIVDNVIMYDMKPQDIKDYYLSKEKEDIDARVDKVIKELEEGGKPYHQFTMDFDEMCESVLLNKTAKEIKEFKAWEKTMRAQVKEAK